MPTNRKQVIQTLSRQILQLQDQLQAEQEELVKRRKEFTLIAYVVRILRCVHSHQPAALQGEQFWLSGPDATQLCDPQVQLKHPASCSSTNTSPDLDCSFSSTTDTINSYEAHIDSISPPEAPSLAFFAAACTAGPVPGTEHITLAELRSIYTGIIKNVNVQLQLLDRPFPQDIGQHQPGQELRKLVTEYFEIWASVIIHGKGHLLYELGLSNSLTGERVEQHDPAPYQWVANNLGITLQQKQRILEAVPVFKRLQQSVLNELQELQQQQQPAEDYSSPAVSPVQLPMGMLEHPSAQELQGKNTEDRANRLRMLLRKQHFIGACYNAHIIGCLTYEQVARFGALMFPYHPFAFHLADAIIQERQAAAERAQQKQRKSQWWL